MAPTLPRSVLLWQACLCLALLPLVASAQPPPAAPTLGEMKEIRPGVFNIGKMQLDKTARTLTFPGTVNMAKGALEYLLVSPAGATHESLLLTTLPPNDVHLAMLLLGAKGAGLTVPAAKDAPPAQITDEYLKSAPALKGDAVFLTVTWKDKSGEEMIVPVEDWITRTDTAKPADRGPWIYTASMFGADGQFLAQQQGVFAALITNPAALINNPRKGNDNDEVWEVNERAVPPVDTAVQITIGFEAPPTPPRPTP